VRIHESEQTVPDPDSNDPLDSGTFASDTDILIADVQGLMPSWLPMLEKLQSAEVPVPEKIKTLKRIAPHVQGTAGFQIIPNLIAILRTETDRDYLHALVQFVGRLRSPCAHDTFVDLALGSGVALFEQTPDYHALLAQETTTNLRCTTIRMLGLLGQEQAIVPLMSLLNDTSHNYRLRLEAAEALGKLRHPDTVSPLIRVLTDQHEKSTFVQESAVKALGLLGDIRALEPLLDLFERQQGIQRKCQFLLERILDAIGKLVMTTDLQETHRQQALRRVLQATTDPARAIRVAAIDALGNIGEDQHLPTLQAALFDEQMDVAHAALAGIYKIGGLSGIQALLELDELPHFLREEILDFILLDAEEPDDPDARAE
jgi:HEAT repeat protein